ncbi:hypothetical protein GCM10027073_71650 [Streptomyces chlorus]
MPPAAHGAVRDRGPSSACGRGDGVVERRLGAEAATAQERARIARELHDVAPHHGTAMAAQADAARFLFAGAPDHRRATAWPPG